MRLLLDTNVLIDYLLRRPGYARDALNLFVIHEFGDAELWASAKSFTDIFYFGRKAVGAENCHAMLSRLVTKLRICSIDDSDIRAALSDPWPDFEDRVVYQAAQKVQASYIVTRNSKHFGLSAIPIIEPHELLDVMERDHNLVYEEVAF